MTISSSPTKALQTLNQSTWNSANELNSGEFFISVAANDQDIDDKFLKKLKAKLSGSADVVG